ncbi:putative gpi anchored cell wall [Phaeomoniella chlamydospora]|uniref:Putative gpi anchored cell wall n=1 Tax=Phaeomoniella chlamydospora TaxID=158046 RepID=A0A0G2G0B9_PHACM|nr:putative gpi anchored cell wall [Phaeomoniella chlamydospora]
MKTFTLASVLLSAGANALVARDGTCCFGLTASGTKANGTVDQLGDGQNRVAGSGLEAGTFCIDSNGAITDGEGRGCLITPETSQFQCDLNKAALPGFSVGSNGALAFNGSASWYICETGGNGENIYVHTSADVTMCTATKLTADNCKNAANSCGASYGSSSSAASSSVAPATVASSVVASVPASSAESATVASSVTASVPASSVASVASSPAQSTTPATSMVATSAPASSEIAGTTTVVSESSSVASSTPAESASPTTTFSTTHTVASATSIEASSIPVASSSPASSVEVSSATAATTSAVLTSSWASQASSTPKYSNSTSSTATSTATSTGTSTASSGCGTALTSGSYQYPHLIIPVNSEQPSKAYGTSYFGYVNSTFSTLFNFDIPTSYEGKTCSLIFDFPLRSELETADYTISGDGAIDFSKLSEVASESTTYNSVPSVATDYGTTTISSGNGYVISTFSCPAGETVAYEMSNAGSTNLWWFNDWNPSPLGLFITVC